MVYGVMEQHLWIADTGNRRVLFYENIPVENYIAADKVIGKNNFEEKDYDSDTCRLALFYKGFRRWCAGNYRYTILQGINMEPLERCIY
jgi:hypothetical protein